MTGDVQGRSKLNSFRFIAVNIAQFIVIGFTLVWVNKFVAAATISPKCRQLGNIPERSEPRGKWP